MYLCVGALVCAYVTDVVAEFILCYNKLEVIILMFFD